MPRRRRWRSGATSPARSTASRFPSISGTASTSRSIADAPGDGAHGPCIRALDRFATRHRVLPVTGERVYWPDIQGGRAARLFRFADYRAILMTSMRSRGPVEYLYVL